MSYYPSRTPKHGFFIKEIKYHGELDLYGLEDEVYRMVRYDTMSNPSARNIDSYGRMVGINTSPIIIIVNKVETQEYPIKSKNCFETKQEIKQEVKQTNKLLLI